MTNISNTQNASNISKLMNYGLPIFVILLLVIPILLQYILNLKILKDSHFTISIYGIYLFIYMILQFCFSFLNNRGIRNINKKNRDHNSQNLNLNNSDNLNSIINPNTLSNVDFKTNILVVGHKEDPSYYRMCLESIKTIYSQVLHINKIYVIIDGNDPDDMYMVDIFKEIFGDSDFNSMYMNLDEYHTTDETIIRNHIISIKNIPFVCITQKHDGKRSAMYTGFQFTLLENNLFHTNIETIFCTDSDTVVDPNCIEEMNKFFENTKVGGVTGNLGIYNKYDSFIAFLTNIRYWFAFNLERAYQSFSGSVLCISGPIGMYKVSSLEKVIESWKDQTFLGKRCTYGDDRHLTNKILDLEEYTVYCVSARAETETPTSMYRFYKQQVRWNKSSFREIFWNVQFINKQSSFMTIDLIYVLVYPFIVMGYFSYILWNGSILEVGIYCGITFSLGIIKSIYGYIISKRGENLLYFLYGFIYITIVFPAKIWALVTINDNKWGTSSRNFLKNELSLDIIPLVTWNFMLISGLSFNIYKSIINNTQFTYYLPIVSIFGCIIFMYTGLFIYIYNKKKKIADQQKMA